LSGYVFETVLRRVSTAATRYDRNDIGSATKQSSKGSGDESAEGPVGWWLTRLSSRRTARRPISNSRRSSASSTTGAVLTVPERRASVRKRTSRDVISYFVGVATSSLCVCDVVVFTRSDLHRSDGEAARGSVWKTNGRSRLPVV